jgi:hypothetical protein
MQQEVVTQGIGHDCGEVVNTWLKKMPCTEPKNAWRYGMTESGKDNYVFKEPAEPGNFEKIQVPCGKCISCKLRKASDWATRLTHESLFYTHNYFITLTYAPEHLPDNESLDKHHLRLFLRKLWKRQKDFVYLAAGEYGHNPRDGKIERPHYHICLLGYKLNDLVPFYINKLNQQVYRSKHVEELWKKGHVTIGLFNYKTAAYTARYTLKKHTETEKFEHVNVDPDTGEILEPEKYERIMRRMKKTPEFLTMSKGIGKKYFKKYKGDLDKGYINVNYKKHPVPKYYDKLMERHDKQKLEELKENRKLKAIENKADNTRVRLRQKDKVIKQAAKTLIRGLDNG